MTRKAWRIHAHDRDRIEHLSGALKVPSLVAHLLITRGVREAGPAREFLDCKLTHLRDPQLLPGVPDAVSQLLEALAQRQRITVYGDYDVDGMTATAILYQCLKLLGAEVSYYVPNRLEEGYGLNHEALRTLAQQGTQTVVTVDCGIASLEEAQTAADLGLRLVITDHHELAERLPPAAAVVHPRLPGAGYPFGGLSGSGVAFKLAWALCQGASRTERVSPRLKEFLLQAVGLAGLGTIADVVPLLDENRVLVRHALASLRERPTPGVAALMKVAQLQSKPALDCDDVAFMLAPRLNAAGRLGQAQLGVELLLTPAQSRATALAEYLNELNSSRQSLERSIYLAAHKQVKDEFDPAHNAALVLAGRGWHPGVIGIVAGRLAEKYHRPVVLVALDELGVRPGVGSARSIRGYDLHEALAACGHHLVGFGGHAAAAGLKIDEGRLEDFRADFCEHAAEQIDPACFLPELWIDGEAPLAAFSLETVQQIERLAPFGHSNARPLFCATGVELDGPPQRMGGGGHHLALKVRQHGTRLRAVSFGSGDRADELAALDGPLAIAFRPVINTFAGRRNVELHLVDWQPVGREALANAAAASGA